MVITGNLLLNETHVYSFQHKHVGLAWLHIQISTALNLYPLVTKLELGVQVRTQPRILDAAAKGFKKITMTDADYTLPLDNNPSAVENGHYAGIEFSGKLCRAQSQ